MADAEDQVNSHSEEEEVSEGEEEAAPPKKAAKKAAKPADSDESEPEAEVRHIQDADPQGRARRYPLATLPPDF